MSGIGVVEPSEEEINTALDTLKLDRSELDNRLNVRRVFLDFMRYRLSQSKGDGWESYREPASKTV